VRATFLDLLDALATEESPARVGGVYGRLFALLADEAELSTEPPVGDAWQNHLLDRILTSDNPFSRKAERAPLDAMGEGLLRQCQREMNLLYQLYRDGGGVIAMEAFSALGEVTPERWSEFRPLAQGPRYHHPEALAFKQAMAGTSDWPSLVPELAAAYAAAGVGVFGRFRAFRWVRKGERGSLEGVPYPDPVRLGELIGYDQERQPAVRNAERFAAGYPANNVLLYGERGTGKSSTVKALLNEYGDRGLRLIEVLKEHLDDFPDLVGQLRNRRERFIIYVDDLSFEEQETHYKALKAILEGGIEARPANVVLYATSNRRHLIRERFSDRELRADDEVHALDTMEEKLSLADRFGIRVTFAAPDQDRYLDIARALASKAGIDLPPDELDRRALSWAQRQRGRSGRTARQFVDALVGELALP